MQPKVRASTNFGGYQALEPSTCTNSIKVSLFGLASGAFGVAFVKVGRIETRILQRFSPILPRRRQVVA
jgi:hypothetical protein